jgi:transposase
MSEAKRGMSRMTVITGEERRRRWSDEDRNRILAAIAEPGAVIAEVARRADVCTSLVYKWRREARRLVNPSGFARVVVEDAASAAATSLPDEIGPAVILVRMKDAQVRIGMHAPPAVIAATLKALRS